MPFTRIYKSSLYLKNYVLISLFVQFAHVLNFQGFNKPAIRREADWSSESLVVGSSKKISRFNFAHRFYNPPLLCDSDSTYHMSVDSELVKITTTLKCASEVGYGCLAVYDRNLFKEI